MKYYQVNFHAETHYMRNEEDDKNFLKGLSVTFSKFKLKSVHIKTETWIDKQASRHSIIEISKETFTKKFNEAIDILKSKINNNQ